MNKFLEKIELIVDKSIPPLLAVLIVIVMVEFFNRELAEAYHLQITIADYVIVTFFVIDLMFKYNRVRDIPRFLRLYWMDIVAVLPFALALRFFSEIILVSEELVNAFRNLFHIGVVIEEAAKAPQSIEELAKIAESERLARTAETITKEERLTKAAEVVSKESRFARLERFVRPLARLPRFFKALSFYEHPKEKKTLYH